MKKKWLGLLLVLLLPFIVNNVYAEESQYDLIILKIDSSSTRLGGAEFALCSDNLCEEEIERSKSVMQHGSDSGYMMFNTKLDFDKIYYIKEVKAPLGYRVRTKSDGTPFIWEFYVKKVDGHISTHVTNSYLYGYGWQSDTHCTYPGSLSNKFFMEIRDNPTANLLVHKTDSSGNVIEGTTYKLTTGDKEEFATTDKNGNAIFDMLNPVDYVLEEVEATPGYIKDDSLFSFYVDDSSENFNLYQKKWDPRSAYQTVLSSFYGRYDVYRPPEYVPIDGRIYYVLKHEESEAPTYKIEIEELEEDDIIQLSDDKDCDNIIEEYTTDDNGSIIINDLISSKDYYLCKKCDAPNTIPKSIEIKVVHSIKKENNNSISDVKAYINQEESSSISGGFDDMVLEIGSEVSIECIKEDNNKNKLFLNPETKSIVGVLLLLIVMPLFSIFLLKKMLVK